jgi:hypothetical protein
VDTIGIPSVLPAEGLSQRKGLQLPLTRRRGEGIGFSSVPVEGNRGNAIQTVHFVRANRTCIGSWLNIQDGSVVSRSVVVNRSALPRLWPVAPIQLLLRVLAFSLVRVLL